MEPRPTCLIPQATHMCPALWEQTGRASASICKSGIIHSFPKCSRILHHTDTPFLTDLWSPTHLFLNPARQPPWSPKCPLFCPQSYFKLLPGASGYGIACNPNPALALSPLHLAHGGIPKCQAGDLLALERDTSCSQEPPPLLWAPTQELPPLTAFLFPSYSHLFMGRESNKGPQLT